MNKFLIDSYTGLNAGRISTKSFSAYDSSSKTLKDLNDAASSERDKALETVRRLREKEREEQNKNNIRDAKTLFERAKAAKEMTSNDAQTNIPETTDVNTEKSRKVEQNTSINQTDEEIKANLKKMEELNKKMKEASLTGTPDEILSSVLTDLF